MTGWERVQWITLALIPRLGRRTLERLLAHFGSLDAVLSADDAALKAVPRIGAKTAAAIRAADPHATAAALDDWQAAEISALLPGDDAFPARLAALDDSPAVLFWRGSALPGADTPCVAIVGTRRPTRAARELALALAETLVPDGWTVVSGLALGIDTAAHSGALSGRGMTVAVLGSGLSTIYPPSNAALAEHIAAHGALLSEVHPDATPDRSALVARNRLISGLSDAVIVVEAGLDSGSLHAARFAQAYGRALFTADSPAAGNRRLLAEGAVRLPADAARWREFLAPYRPR